MLRSFPDTGSCRAHRALQLETGHAIPSTARLRVPSFPRRAGIPIAITSADLRSQLVLVALAFKVALGASGAHCRTTHGQSRGGTSGVCRKVLARSHRAFTGLSERDRCDPAPFRAARLRVDQIGQVWFDRFDQRVKVTLRVSGLLRKRD